MKRGTSATAARKVVVKSDGNVEEHAKDGYAVTQHRFAKPGHYLVRVSNERMSAAREPSAICTYRLRPERAARSNRAITKRNFRC